jgi:aarF domain-containing kinase
VLNSQQVKKGDHSSSGPYKFLHRHTFTAKFNSMSLFLQDLTRLLQGAALIAANVTSSVAKSNPLLKNLRDSRPGAQTWNALDVLQRIRDDAADHAAGAPQPKGAHPSPAPTHATSPPEQPAAAPFAAEASAMSSTMQETRTVPETHQARQEQQQQQPPLQQPPVQQQQQHQGPVEATPATPPRSRHGRERKVPSGPFSRAVGFAGIGTSLLFGAAREAVGRAFSPSPSPPSPPSPFNPSGIGPAHSVFLSDSNARVLADGLARMRGAALKLGQMLSIQDEELVPPALAEALERVRAAADFMPRAQLEKALTNELGQGWRERLAEFDYTPVAAASIGQVHAATLHDGRKVMIKVQYPGVAESIQSDVSNLVRLLRLAGGLPKGLFLNRAAEVAAEELAAECDFEREADAQERFAELVEEDPEVSRFCRVPGVVRELSTGRVLTTEFAPGVHIDQVASASQEARDEVGTRLLQLTLTELFRWRFMQASLALL